MQKLKAHTGANLEYNFPEFYLSLNLLEIREKVVTFEFPEKCIDALPQCEPLGCLLFDTISYSLTTNKVSKRNLVMASGSRKLKEP